jgi:hypothetical protein
VVIYENRWVLGLVDAWRRDGARLIADGGISASDIGSQVDTVGDGKLPGINLLALAVGVLR